MASRPDNEPPESIILAQFNGINNTVSAERLAPGDLEIAKDVDLDDAGQLRRRRGRRLVASGDWHSLRSIAEQYLGVRDGHLGYVGTDYTHTPLVEVGPHKLSYTNVGSTVYFSSQTASGKIVAGESQPWGASASEGQWVSPVQTPTDTLGSVSGKPLNAPPMATEIEHFKGRIYLASGKLLWATELYLYDQVDRTRNFLQFENDITMLRAVADGIYVGTTTQLLFLRGTLSSGFTTTTIMDSPVVQGSAVDVPLSKVHPSARGGDIPEGIGVVFMTAGGICLGLDGGQVLNLTQRHMAFPHAQSAAALYREDQGANSYLAVVDSAGGPSTNARIGDYIDAQIIRASQGG